MTTEALTAIKAALAAGRWEASVYHCPPPRRKTDNPLKHASTLRLTHGLYSEAVAISEAKAAIESGWGSTTSIHRETAKPCASFYLPHDHLAAIGRELPSLISSYEAMERRVEELEAALTPFADVGDLILAEAPTESNYWEAFSSCDGTTYQISLEYLRRARSTLTSTVEKVETPAQDTPPPEAHTTGLTDTQLLDALASNYWDLRCVDVPTGGDDADIDWIVIEHHQGKPSEVEVDRAHRDDPRVAIRRALRSSDKNAACCVSCDEVLHDGDSVYYEHGEGGHIHSWCASDDPESFADDDDVPLKAGDEIPKPFAYSVEKYEGQP